MSRTLFFLALMLLCSNSVSVSDELTQEELIQGVNQARFTIQSGEVVAITTVKRHAGQSDAEVAEWKKAQREIGLKTFFPEPLYPDVGIKEFEEDFLIPTLNFEAAWLQHRTEMERTTTVFQVLHPELADVPAPYRYKITIEELLGQPLDTQNAQFLFGNRFYLLAYDTETQVKHEIGNTVYGERSGPTVELFGSDKHGGFWFFHQFARSAYPVPGAAKLVGKETIDGAECHILGYTNKDGWRRKIWVDAAKDFCIRKAENQIPRTQGTAVSHITFKHFKRFGEVWFPTLRETIAYRADGTVRNETRVEIVAAQFNVDFPKDFFKIDREFYGEPREELQRPGTDR